MYPLAPWSRNQASMRSSPSEASASTYNAVFSSASSSGYSYISLPPPPPPSPEDCLLDISRRCSMSGRSITNMCAFPAWPNRPSLIGSDSDDSNVSSYISDEELLLDCPLTAAPAVDEESAANDPQTFGPGSLTTEQQIQLLRAAAEEEAQRARFLAQVQAHARAQQALRAAQAVAATERETTKRSKKRKPSTTEKKRRPTSSSRTVVFRT